MNHREAFQDIPEAEKGETPLVSQQEMEEAVKALDAEGIPEAEKITIESSPVTEDEMQAAVEMINEPSSLERDAATKEKIAALKKELGDSAIVESDSGGGGNGSGTSSALTYGGDDESRQPIMLHRTKYERMHGDTLTVARKAFGQGFLGMLNLFNPFAWAKYRKMMEEHNDESLTKETHSEELLGYYTPNSRPQSEETPE